MSSSGFPPALQRLVHELTKLPSVGEKSAIRLAYHLITRPPDTSYALAEAIREAREKTLLCSKCFALAEQPLCDICRASQRDPAVLCVVEKPSDVLSIERSGGYRGLYHVLHGLWSPMRGVSPEQTRLPQLLRRLGLENGARSAATIAAEKFGDMGTVPAEESRASAEPPVVTEVILAMGTTVEGDATALYIAQALQGRNIRVSRIAQGIPKGGDLEYTDELTLTHAIQSRRTL